MPTSVANLQMYTVSVPSNRNTSTKVIEKLSKYKDIEIETMRMWGMRAETVPVIVGALGLLREGMDQNFKERSLEPVTLMSCKRSST